MISRRDYFRPKKISVAEIAFRVSFLAALNDLVPCLNWATWFGVIGARLLLRNDSWWRSANSCNKMQNKEHHHYYIVLTFVVTFKSELFTVRTRFSMYCLSSSWALVHISARRRITSSLFSSRAICTLSEQNTEVRE